HGVWLDERDLAIIAARGIKIAVNTSSNLRLRSGLAPVPAFKRHGVRFGLGLDGLSLEDDDDMLREMRLTLHLQAGSDLDQAVPHADVFAAASVVGREVLDGCKIDPSSDAAPADLVLIDRDRLAPDLVAEADQDLALMMTRATARHISHLVVDGREAGRDGPVLGVDLEAAEHELMRAARAAAPNGAALDFVARHRARLKAFYQAGRHTGAGGG